MKRREKTFWEPSGPNFVFDSFITSPIKVWVCSGICITWSSSYSSKGFHATGLHDHYWRNLYLFLVHLIIYLIFLLASMGYGYWKEIHHSLHIWMWLQHEGKIISADWLWNSVSTYFIKWLNFLHFLDIGSTQYFYFYLLANRKFTGGINLWEDWRMEIWQEITP